jgi:succinate-semialdehyde dehydrogenase/glutarate-semialdehyde dehydrogenase
VHDRFVDALVAGVRKLRLGQGLDAGTTHGPLITSAAVSQARELCPG